METESYTADNILSHVPVVIKKIDGNVLCNMQDLHYTLFKNKRSYQTGKKKLKFAQNILIKHRYKPYPLHSKDVFNSIKETTNYLLEQEHLEMYKINDTNINRVCIYFHQNNYFDCDKNNYISYSMFHKDKLLMSKCISVIYCVRKDMGIIGGNFLYIKQNSVDKIARKNIKEGDVLIYNGDLKHAQEPIYGIGCCDMVSVFIPIN